MKRIALLATLCFAQGTRDFATVNAHGMVLEYEHLDTNGTPASTSMIMLSQQAPIEYPEWFGPVDAWWNKWTHQTVWSAPPADGTWFGPSKAWRNMQNGEARYDKTCIDQEPNSDGPGIAWYNTQTDKWAWYNPRTSEWLGPIQSLEWSWPFGAWFNTQTGDLAVYNAHTGKLKTYETSILDQAGAAADEAAEFKPGVLVVIHGLKASPQFNDQTGIIQGPAAGEGGRFEVQLMNDACEPNGDVKSFKAANLRTVWANIDLELHRRKAEAKEKEEADKVKVAANAEEAAKKADRLKVEIMNSLKLALGKSLTERKAEFRRLLREHAPDKNQNSRASNIAFQCLLAQKDSFLAETEPSLSKEQC